MSATLLIQWFVGFPEPDEHIVYEESENIDLKEVELVGGFLAKTLVLSLDPAMRTRMRDPTTKAGSVSPPRSVVKCIH